MATGTLRDAFVDELKDSYDGEKQLIKALKKMAKAAKHEDLRSAFETHLEETQGQVQRLEQVFAMLDEKVKGKHCDGIAGIIEEGKSIMEEDFDDETMDACLIAAGQRAEHYEMAAYGTLVAWADVLGLTEAAELLQTTLDEEKAADEKLTTLAESGINQGAGDAGASADDEEEATVGVSAGRDLGLRLRFPRANGESFGVAAAAGFVRSCVRLECPDVAQSVRQVRHAGQRPDGV